MVTPAGALAFMVADPGPEQSDHSVKELAASSLRTGPVLCLSPAGVPLTVPPG